MNDVRRKRTKDCFVDSTCHLIKSEGMSAATIRNISERAGYNSATLYSYFDNLPHLILCAHMRFEEELLNKFKAEIAEKQITEFYQVWPHMYTLMAEYYIENPNIFDCAFVLNYAGEAGGEMHQKREHESLFDQYVHGSLKKIAKETGKDLKIIERINAICLSQVVGMVLLCVKKRISVDTKVNFISFERDIGSMIDCFMTQTES